MITTSSLRSHFPLKGGIAHFGGDMLQIIEDCEIFADGESILIDLVEQYESHPGFMFVFRTLSKTFWSVNYCWWLFTDDIAVHYEYNDNYQTMLCWATPPDMERIRALVGRCCPF